MVWYCYDSVNIFQSTPPVKAATRKLRDRRRAGRISIHAAREGGDIAVIYNLYKTFRISIHAAREGGDRKNTV